MILMINCCDWIALYYNGVIFAQGHHIDYLDYIRLGIQMGEDDYCTGDINSVHISDEFQEEHNLWDFPTYMSDIPPKTLETIMKKMHS